jgi:RecA/RadA recombinase
MADFLKKIVKKESSAVAAEILKADKSLRIYCGDPSLDWCIGGWAKGRLNLVYGPTKSGKSAMTIMAAAQIQKEDGGYVIIYDSEYYYKDDPDQMRRLETFGLDLNKTVIISSNRIGELFYGLGDLEEDVKKGKLKVSAIIVDSWGGIQSETAEKKIGDNKANEAGASFGGNAKYLNPILGSLLRLSAENNITLLAVQHCIKNQEQYGDKWILLGGERLRYLAFRTLFVEGSSAKAGKLLDGDMTLDEAMEASEDKVEVAVGKKILARCEKSRSVVEGRKAEFYINFAECRFAKKELSLFNLATNLGIIVHPKNDEGKENVQWWQYPVSSPAPLKVHGMAKMIDMLSKDENLYKKVLNDCMNSNSQGGTKEKMTDVATTEAPEAEITA